MAATLYVNQDDVDSKLPWLYTLLTKSPIEVVKVDVTNNKDSNNLVNPTKVAPYLVADNACVWGAVAVILHIAEKFSSNAMYGKTIEERAKINATLFWCSGTLARSVLINYVYPHINEIYRLPKKEDNTLMLELGMRNTVQQLDAMEGMYFQDNKFMCGERETVADYYAAFVLMELEKLNFDLSKWPKTLSWLIEMRKKIKTVL